MSIEQNKQIALRFCQEGFGNLAVWDEVVAADFVYHFCNLETITGLDAAKKFEQSLFDGFPNLQRQIEDVVAEGNNVVIRSILRGEQTGMFLEMPPTNKSVRVIDLVLMKIEGGKIVELWYELNQLAVMQQLGIAPI